MKLLKVKLYSFGEMFNKRDGKSCEAEYTLINPINISSVVSGDADWCRIDIIGRNSENDAFECCYANIDAKEIKSMIEEAMDDIRIEDIDKFCWRDYVITTKEKK